MANSTPEQLCFPTTAGFTVRADFQGGEVSSDLGSILLSSLDRRIGLIDRITAAVADRRHASYITHPLRDLIAQRIFQIASGYEDGNDADALRGDPLFKLATARAPLAQDNDLASGSTFSRLESQMRRADIYRMAEAMVEQFVAGYPAPPASIILDLDHTDDRVHGQQPLAFYNTHYSAHCYLPLLVFEAHSSALVMAILRPGKRPTGQENAMIMKRLLRRLRQHWPDTHILVRGDSHFGTPELMALIDQQPNMDFVFGLGQHSLLLKRAEGLLRNARGHFKLHQSLATLRLGAKVASMRLFGEFDYAARSWRRAYRVVVKAEVIEYGDNPRFVVTSLVRPSAEAVYCQHYCARGQMENYIKQIKCDLKSDRTSAGTFIANFARLLFTAAAYVLHQQFRHHALQDTPLARAEPNTVILKLFKIAARVKQYKDRVILHLPSSCPVKELLKLVTERLCPSTRRKVFRLSS